MVFLEKSRRQFFYNPTAAKSLSATPYGIMRHTDQLSINLTT